MLHLLLAATLATSGAPTPPSSASPPANAGRCYRYATACGICFTLPRSLRVKVWTPEHKDQACCLTADNPATQDGFTIRVDRRPFDIVASDCGFRMVDGEWTVQGRWRSPAMPFAGIGWTGLMGEPPIGGGDTFRAVIHAPSGPTVYIDTDGPWYSGLEQFFSTVSFNTDSPCRCETGRPKSRTLP